MKLLISLILAGLFTVFLPSTEGVGVAVTEVTATGATVTVTHNSDFVITSMSADPAGSVSFNPSTPSTTKSQSHAYTVTSLEPGTSYVFKAAGLMTDTAANSGTALNPDFADSPATCSKPRPVTTLQLDTSGTSETEIKITWNNPSPGPDKLSVKFDDFSIDLPDPTAESYIYQLSAADTPLTASTSGSCKVVSKIVGGDCNNEESEATVACSTADSNGVSIEVAEVTDSTATVTLSKSDNFVITSVETTPAGNSAFEPSTPATSASTSFKYKISGLEAGKQYNFQAKDLKDAPGGTALIPPNVVSPAFCTKPAAVSDIAVETSGTTETEIKITWNNPVTDPEQLSVMFDSFTVELPSPLSKEHIYKLSAADTPLTAGKAGECKVVNTILSGPCAGQENSAQIACSTKGKEGSSAIRVSNTSIYLSVIIVALMNGI